MDLTTVYDCMGAKLPGLTVPPGVLLAGYITGSGDVPWTDQQFAAHPYAVRIDQSPIDTPFDETADLIDVEPQAGTVADVPEWVHGAWVSYRTGRRPGQRTPTIYAYESELTPIANTLNAAGITSGVNIWLSKPMQKDAAISILNAASGPFPIIGVQYEFNTSYDVSLVSTAWLNNVSKAPGNTQQPASGAILKTPPGQWKKSVIMLGIGLDNNIWITEYNIQNGAWSEPRRDV